jgi:DNA polymerase-3 subunit alpha
VEPKALNKRQVEALAAAGVFDGLCARGPADRARVHAGADMLLAAAQGAARERAEGQGGLFGGPAGATVPLPHEAPWRLAEALAHERAAFGFYWSGHPVEAHAQVLEAQGVVRSDEVLERRPRVGVSSQSVMMAGIVEEAGWRTPAGRGADRRFLTADFSDAGGKWGGTCFDPPTQDILLRAAESAAPLLLSVELNWRDGDEAPRLRIASAALLEDVAGRTRLLFRVRLAAGAAPDDVVALLRRLPRGGRSDVIVEVPVAGTVATVRLGRDFRLPGGVDEEFRAMGQVAGATIESAAGPLRLVA